MTSYQEKFNAFKQKFEGRGSESLSDLHYVTFMNAVFEEMAKRQIKNFQGHESFFRDLFENKLVAPIGTDGISKVLFPSIGSKLLSLGTNMATMSREYRFFYVLLFFYCQTQTPRFAELKSSKIVMSPFVTEKPKSEPVLYNVIHSFSGCNVYNEITAFNSLIEAFVDYCKASVREKYGEPVTLKEKLIYWHHLKQSIHPFQSSFNCGHFFLYVLLMHDSKSHQKKFGALKTPELMQQMGQVQQFGELRAFWEFLKENEVTYNLEEIVDAIEVLYNHGRMGLILNRGNEEGLFSTLMRLSAWSTFNDVFAESMTAQIFQVFKYHCNSSENIDEFDKKPDNVIKEMLHVVESCSKLRNWVDAIDCASGRIGEGALRVMQFAREIYSPTDNDRLICMLDTVSPIGCEWNFEDALDQTLCRVGEFTFGTLPYRVVLTPFMNRSSDFKSVWKEPDESATVALLRRLGPGGDLDQRAFNKCLRYLYCVRRSNLAEAAGFVKGGRRNKYANRISAIHESLCAILQDTSVDAMHEEANKMILDHDPALEPILFLMEFKGIENPIPVSRPIDDDVSELPSANDVSSAVPKEPRASSNVLPAEITAMPAAPKTSNIKSTSNKHNIQNDTSLANVKRSSSRRNNDDDDNDDDEKEKHYSELANVKQSSLRHNQDDDDDDDVNEITDADEDVDDKKPEETRRTKRTRMPSFRGLPLSAARKVKNNNDDMNLVLHDDDNESRGNAAFSEQSTVFDDESSDANVEQPLIHLVWKHHKNEAWHYMYFGKYMLSESLHDTPDTLKQYFKKKLGVKTWNKKTKEIVDQKTDEYIADLENVRGKEHMQSELRTDLLMPWRTYDEFEEVKRHCGDVNCLQLWERTYDSVFPLNSTVTEKEFQRRRVQFLNEHVQMIWAKEDKKFYLVHLKSAYADELGSLYDGEFEYFSTGLLIMAEGCAKEFFENFRPTPKNKKRQYPWTNYEEAKVFIANKNIADLTIQEFMKKSEPEKKALLAQKTLTTFKRKTASEEKSQDAEKSQDKKRAKTVIPLPITNEEIVSKKIVDENVVFDKSPVYRNDVAYLLCHWKEKAQDGKVTPEKWLWVTQEDFLKKYNTPSGLLEIEFKSEDFTDVRNNYAEFGNEHFIYKLK